MLVPCTFFTQAKNIVKTNKKENQLKKWPSSIKQWESSQSIPASNLNPRRWQRPQTLKYTFSCENEILFTFLHNIFLSFLGSESGPIPTHE